MSAGLQRASFRAMGTVCSVAVTAELRDAPLARRSLAAARAEVDACERALSRFDEASELTRLNRGSGSWVAVGGRLAAALSAAVEARIQTGGRFDPTILPVLAAAGYDRSFELLAERPSRPVAGWRPGACIDVDLAAGRARVEQGAAVDLGGIGKGFASTLALTAIREAWPGSTGALVDLGGDISVWGSPPEGGRWRVDVTDPRDAARPACTLELSGGGVATSGRDARRFGPAGRLHHLIDPAAGAPAVAGPLAVTVVAAGAAEAEAHATALAVSPVEDASGYIALRPGLAALLIPVSGDPVALGRLPRARERHESRFLITTETGRFSWH